METLASLTAALLAFHVYTINTLQTDVGSLAVEKRSSVYVSSCIKGASAVGIKRQS